MRELTFGDLPDAGEAPASSGVSAGGRDPRALREGARRMGPMDVARASRLYAQGLEVRVLVDEVDVTEHCQSADDTPGNQHAVLLYTDKVKDRWTGAEVSMPVDGPVTATATGHVRFVLRSRIPAPR